MQKFDTELFDTSSEDEGMLSISLFLDPDGITVDSEVLAFDFYDLMGNVGGFLGLFLGASILSMYDALKSSLTRMNQYKK